MLAGRCIMMTLRFLTLSPPLYSTDSPVPTVSPKTVQTADSGGSDTALAEPQAPKELQEYCLGTSGEPFLPILFEESGGVAECVPPDELLLFEEDALREIACHVEAKLVHALTCMGTRARGKRCRLGFVAEQEPSESTPKSPEVLAAGFSGSETQEEAFIQSRANAPGAEAGSSSPASESPTTLGAKNTLERDLGVKIPRAAEADPERSGVVVGLEDLVVTYGPSPSLMRHQCCFHQGPDSRPPFR
ncbi:hypothetical protein cyc_06039 [Cyclospora cayetanensis]|uniref:Uncharacterized protein n=1 Tax=Cyclospora cayetanensis TaxID=88456 RepID=A0A1D3D7E8_9EIME|nr:hypothetical protein cyc_06039 [Cyclospora cayetanensis]